MAIKEISEAKSLLLTDLYQLTMLHGYFEQGMQGDAVFEFFVRELPPKRNFLLAAGLEQLLDFLEQARFSKEEIDWLRQTELFPQDFLDNLSGFQFTGDVYAMPEGTVFFPQEPVVRVVAPISQAQLIETRLINLIHFETLIASKAARCRLAAPGKLLVDFGLRRAHGAEAGLLAARATYVAGFAGTSTVSAGYRFGIPIYGTMAHSFIQSHNDELEAFEGFARAQKNNVTLLIDTYDTEKGAQKVVTLAPRLAEKGIHVRGVRLDSGDLTQHARKVRSILNEGGLGKTTIFASGNLDEDSLLALIRAGAPIDGFGVGTRLDTSADAPYLDCAYKLMEYDGKPRRKKSEGKATWPGRKQVYRRYDSGGFLSGDQITLEEETAEGEPLLEKVMERGRRVGAQETLAAIRERANDSLGRLPPALRNLEQAARYPVTLSEAIRNLARSMNGEQK